ncbi:MAG: PDZ domain-containing protein [Chthonomonas sp.]|nr:PDZ domain-containing protein [Chthonomonas sp.]
MKKFSRSAFAALLSVAALPAFAQPDPVKPAQTLTAEEKQEILDDVSTVILKFAYVPGIDFSKWPEILAAQKDRIDKATDAFSFANAVNQALNRFSASHIVLNTPEAATAMVRQEFVGLGIQPMPSNDGILINYVFPRSAADEVGLEIGDIIMEADGKALKTTEALRGTEGSKVTIKVKKRNGTIQTHTVTRKKFSTRRPETLTWVNPNVAKLEIPSFMSYSYETVGKLMGEAQRAKALIVDLRGNGGGQVIALLHLCGYFVPTDTVMGAWVTKDLVNTYTKETNGSGTDLSGMLKYALDKNSRALVRPNAVGKTQYKGEVIVLIDGGTGSASEMFAAAMKENRSAQVIGSKSAGAVLASRLYPIKHEFMIQYPFQDYITVKGLRLEGNGVEPTIKSAGRARLTESDPGVSAALLFLRNTKVITD